MMEWKQAQISEFLFERKGRYKPDDETIKSLERLEKIDFSGNFFIGKKPSRTDMILIKKGDFVISGINVSKGAMGIYRQKEDITATIHYSSYTFDEDKIDIEYFENFLQSVEFIKLLQEQVKGGIKTEIKAKHLLNLKISLPPDINYQRQIAQKLKSSQNKQNNLKQLIENQKTYLKNLRAQILQDAIEGKLTKDWREQNPDVEPASELLKIIKQEKEKLIAEKKIKKEKPLPPIEESEIPFELPKNWVWTRLGEIKMTSEYGTSEKGYENIEGFPILAMGNISEGKILLNSKKNIASQSKELPRLFLQKGDVLFNRTNSWELVGKSGIFNGKNDSFTFASYLIRLKFIKNLVCSEFINFYLNSKSFRKTQIEPQIIQQCGQANFNGTKLSNTLSPLPPFLEQKAIISKLQSIMYKLDEAEKAIEDSLDTSNLLTKSILAEAFDKK